MADDMIELWGAPDGISSAEATSFSVRQLLEGTGDVLGPMLEEKRVRLSTVVEGTDEYLGDSVAIGRVLLNLATTALEYTIDDVIEIRVLPIDEQHSRVQGVRSGNRRQHDMP